MKTVLITGINGFIGKILCKEIKQAYPGFHVIGIDIADKSELCDEYYSMFLGKDDIPSKLLNKKIDYIIHSSSPVFYRCYLYVFILIYFKYESNYKRF